MWRFLKKLEIELPYDPAIPLLGTHTEETRILQTINAWRGCGEKGTFLHCGWEHKLIQPLWRTVWRFLNKLGIKLPYDLWIPQLGIYPEKNTQF